MAVRSAFLFLGSVAVFGLLGLELRGDPSAAAKPDRQPADLEGLIRQLGSREFQTRDRASQALLKAGEAAVPLLERVLDSDDIEVRRRAQALIREVRQQVCARLMRHGIDQMVDRLVAGKPAGADEDWDMLARLAEAGARARMPKVERRLQPGEYLHFPVLVKSELKEMAPAPGIIRRRVIAGRAAVRDRVLDSFIVCSGPADIGWAVTHSVVVANGNVKGGDTLGDCLIISAGDVTVDGITNSVIVARGAVDTGGGVVENTVILCNQGVTGDGRIIDSVIRAGGVVDLLETARNSIIKEKQPNPLGSFGFFDPARLGIRVELKDQAVRVAAVAAGSAFARAGIIPGDEILSVGKGRVRSVEEFRVLLRRREPEGSASLTLRRQDRELDITVRFDR